LSLSRIAAAPVAAHLMLTAQWGPAVALLAAAAVGGCGALRAAERVRRCGVAPPARLVACTRPCPPPHRASYLQLHALACPHAGRAVHSARDLSPSPPPPPPAGDRLGRRRAGAPPRPHLAPWLLP
jgi:hypothetical protein